MSTSARSRTESADEGGNGPLPVQRALLTVSDKRGIAEFAAGLAELGVEIVSTGGTATAIAEGGTPVRPIEDYTGFPEILDGRVKTLHPRIYAGLLAIRSSAEHRQALEQHQIEPIDLVCVNLYPFQRTAARRGVSDEEVLEQIDIGGPTLIRAAAKNHSFAAVVVEPESYDAVLAELRESGGDLSRSTREALATEAFAYTAAYDAAISRWFAERVDEFPDTYVRGHEKVLDLSYGENPHQRAAYYAQTDARVHVLSKVSKLQGKPLSFNNLLDLDAGRWLVDEFQVPAAAIIKHNNPCGCALGADVAEAYERALASDPISAFGGVVCLNREVDEALAKRLSEQFIEVLFAPGYGEGALEALAGKPNVRILRNDERRRPDVGELDLRRVRGGMLLQDRDTEHEDRDAIEVVTKRRPTDDEWGDLLFSWRVAKHVRSNAIVMGKGLATAGIGGGQTSRVDAVRLAVEKAGQTDHGRERLQGSALASDAFFPFADGPQAAIEAGVRSIIQPGGSQRDAEVVEACDAADVAMVFTRRRHFRH